jgi:hypothetical protein
VLRENKKYVHAGVAGILADWYVSDSLRLICDGESIGYNPRKGGTFYEHNTNLPRLKADKVVMRDNREVIAS